MRRQENQTWILRATIDTEIFDGMVKAAQLGQRGDAFVVNRVEGRVGEILVPSGARVERGRPLMRLGNEEIDFAIREVDGGRRSIGTIVSRVWPTVQA